MSIIKYDAFYTLKCYSNGWYIPKKLIKQIYNGADPYYFRIITEKDKNNKSLYKLFINNNPYELINEDEQDIIDYVPIGKFTKNKIGTYILKSTMDTLYPEVIISNQIKAIPADDYAILEQII